MLNGKTAIVTGASRGIGRAIALELAKKGVNIIAVYAAGRENAEAVCRECRGRYQVRAKAYACDVSDFESVGILLSAVKEEFGSVQILVNNAGITRDGLAVTMKEKDFDAVLDTNLKGAFHMIRHCLPVFVRAREGSIINISSVTGLMGNAGQCNYAASKAGLVGLTKSIAREYASKGIRCNAVAPGFIDTDMTKELITAELKARIPLGRAGLPEEVAEAVAYLADAAYVTGEVLRVDGGMAM